MSKRITIEPHLTLEELEQRYRAAKCPVERSHYQIIWLLAQGRPSEEVASITGYSRSWIYELVWGYNRVGVETLGDKRHDHPGATPLLNAEEFEEFKKVVQPKWTGVDAARWMSDRLGVEVTRQRGWEYLKKAKSRGEQKKVKGEVWGDRVRRSKTVAV